MEINSYPANVKDTSTLKLVAAAKLPESIPVKKPSPAESVALSDEALMQVSKLKARDEQLHQHEQAHHTASNGLDVSSASFTYQRGPNGVNYAVSGDVSIDTSPGQTPEETLMRAEKIRDVALAPVDPTAIDRSVATKAQHMAMQARAEIVRETSNAEMKPEFRRESSLNAYDSETPASKKVDTFA
jgi:hypothetical protein